MNDTKKLRTMVSQPPKRMRWNEIKTENDSGVVVKRPKEEDKEPLEPGEVTEIVVEEEETLEGVEDVKDIPEGQESKYGI